MERQSFMKTKQEILDLPHALRETLVQGRPEYDAVVRRTRWGDGPLFVIGSGPSLAAGLTAVYAFEGLLGWPVVVRSAIDFLAYSTPTLRPRSVMLAISRSGESSEVLAAARAAKSQGATVLALTNHGQSPLATTADGVFLVRCGQGKESGATAVVCQQAALGYIGLVAATALKRHHPQMKMLEEDFEKLPGYVEWVLTQLPDAVRSFAAELRTLTNLEVVGGGFYHAAAVQGALLLRMLSGIGAHGVDAVESMGAPLREGAVIVLSGSRCRVKKGVHRFAEAVGKARGKILAITDSNDRELADRSLLAVLLPTLSEMVGSTLALALLGWMAYHAARERGRGPEPPASASPRSQGSTQNKTTR
jgi:glucosamine--fructose-6-phosphate aminotransferase (isomerizing)